jgi:hypothetical protein
MYLNRLCNGESFNFLVVFYILDLHLFIIIKLPMCMLQIVSQCICFFLRKIGLMFFFKKKVCLFCFDEKYQNVPITSQYVRCIFFCMHSVIFVYFIKKLLKTYCICIYEKKNSMVESVGSTIWPVRWVQSPNPLSWHHRISLKRVEYTESTRDRSCSCQDQPP